MISAASLNRPLASRQSRNWYYISQYCKQIKWAHAHGQPVFYRERYGFWNDGDIMTIKQLISKANHQQRMAASIWGHFPSISLFHAKWYHPSDRRRIQISGKYELQHGTLRGAGESSATFLIITPHGFRPIGDVASLIALIISSIIAYAFMARDTD